MIANYLLTIFFLIVIKGITAEIPCPIGGEIVFFRADKAPVPPTFFLLYTRRNSYYPQNLTFDNCTGNTNFNPNLKTVIILDGYQGSPNSEHIIFLKLAYLQYEDCNVIIVDWSKAAAEFLFPFAIRNTLIIGKYVAKQLEIWKKNCKEINFKNFHIIGFSLGGQTVGFIGKYMKTAKIGRITGLDIVGACFSSFSSKYKLHYSDAEFVDVISVSSATQLLTAQPTGHVHFYPDGGQIGRGCADELADFKLKALFGCTHMRAAYLFASTFFSKCVSVGYLCKDKNTFYKGECSDCGLDGKKCAAMGIHADKYANKTTNETATMYLATTFTDDYCLYQYHVEITLTWNANSTNEMGKLFLNINNGSINTALNKNLFHQYVTEEFKPGRSYTYLVTTTHNIDKISQLEFYWYTTRPRLNSRLYIECIKIVPMNNLEVNRSSFTTFGTTNGEAISPQSPVLLNIGRSC